VSDADQRAEVHLPPEAQRAAVERIGELAAGARGVEELLASITGRWPQVRLLNRYSLGQVEDPPLALLETAGPVLGRGLELLDPGDPGDPDTERGPVPAAVSTELVVLGRLPAAVAAELAITEDPLDRVLDRFDVDWDSELLHTHLIPDQTTSVQVLRRIWVGAEIVALLSEEYPLHFRRSAGPSSDGTADSAP
jgi:hypothetical protein